MKTPYHFLAGLLVLAAGAARGQAPAPLRPVSTIDLGTHTALGGSVQLANHNTVLLLTDTESPAVRLKCLKPDGQPAWEAAVERFQRAKYAYPYFPIGEIFLPQKSAEATRQAKDLHLAQLVSVQVLTDGNTLYTVERIDVRMSKKEIKNSSFKPGQVYVNRVDEQGHLTRAVFEARPEPESNRVVAECMGRYVDGAGYVEVTRETNKREETQVYFLDHYDFASQKLRRESLSLPEPPRQSGGMSSFKEWYQEWAYLGHRPNQTYFCRRTLTTAPTQKPGNQPLTYQVYLTDDRGAATTGFSTTLDLEKLCAPRSSGRIMNTGELDHIPHMFDHSTQRTSYYYDGWDISTGNTGSFRLDRATGNVLIYGEYGLGDVPYSEGRYVLKGYFQRRYSSDGKTLSQMQTPYTDALRAKKKDKLFEGGYGVGWQRQSRFHLDPFTQQSQYSFWLNSMYGSDEMLDLVIDPAQKVQRYDFASKINTDEHLYTSVLFTEPFWLDKNSQAAHDYRVFDHAAKDDAPVYAALEKLRRTAGTKMPFHEFHLTPTGSASGLVVERRQPVGGVLQVYTF